MVTSLHEMESDAGQRQDSQHRPQAGHLFVLFATLWLAVQGQRYTVGSFLGASTLANDLAITAGAAGLLAAAYYPAYGLMQIPAGLLADRGSPKGNLVSAAALLIAATLLFALAPGFEVALLARVGVGLASGLFLMSMLKMLSDRARGGQYAGFVAGLFALGNVGAFASMAALPLVLGVLDWRQATVFTAAPIVACALFLWLLPSPRRAQAALAPAGAASATMKAVLGDLRRILVNRAFWVTCLPLVAWQGVNFGLLNWLPRYSAEVLGMERAATGVLPALIVLGFAAAGPWGGWLFSRFPRAAKPIMFAICGGHVLALGVLVAASDALAGNPLALYALVFLLGLTFAAYVIAMTHVREVVPRELLGTASGALNSIPFLGSFFYPWGMGLVMDAVDRPLGADWTYSGPAYLAAFLAAAGSYVVVLGVALLIDRFAKKRVVEDEALPTASSSSVR